ncbi:MAG: hypothetical protein ACLQVD_02480 [Capsulimonadaceae bacterium]
MPHTYPIPLNRLAEIYVEFASTSLDDHAKTVTKAQVTDVVAAVDQDSEVIRTDQEKYNSIPSIDAFSIEVGMHVLAFLIGHGLIHVGKLGWKQFWSRPKSQIVKDTQVNVNSHTDPVIDKAILFLLNTDPNKLAEDWNGETKP